LEQSAYKIEGQKVWLVYDPVELKSFGFVIVWPREEIAHFRNNGTRQVTCGRHLQSAGCRDSP
jgi:hypothetical protein